MYIIFLAFAYIWVMLMVTASSWINSAVVFVFGGMLLALIYYLLDTPGRKHRRLHVEKQEDQA